MKRLAILLLTLAGCGSNDATTIATTTCAPGCCLTDPIGHCAVIYGCTSSEQCPGGLSCATLESPQLLPLTGTNRPLRDCTIGAGAGVDYGCRLPTYTDDSGATLIHGFGTALLPLTPVPGVLDYAAFTWKAPIETKIVECALFGCPPLIDGGVITNFAQCVLAEHPYFGVDDSFDLGDAALGYDPEKDAYLSSPIPRSFAACASSAPGVKAAVTYTALQVGCWAYDETRIVAASRLQPIKIEQIANYPRFTKTTKCGEKDEGPSCVTIDDVLGRCHAGQCQHFCVDVKDCKVAACGKSMMRDAHWTCDQSSDTTEQWFVGTCVPSTTKGIEGRQFDCDAP